MVETRKVTGRRSLSFRAIDDLLADVDGLGRGPVEGVGNWTPGQIVTHVAMFVEASLDGFDVSVPLPLRFLGRLVRRRALSRGLPAGFRLRGKLARYEPDPAAMWEGAVARLRRAVERIRSGERMTQPSPVLGPMTHEDWTRFHCRHAELHFSFLRPAPGSAPSGDVADRA